MMELTRKGEYAIRGMIYLARQPQGKVALIGEMAKGVDVPQAFLAKIFQSFAKQGLVSSSRGAGGGFVLARPASTITFREIVEAVEGPIILNRCLVEGVQCDRESSCSVHPVWRRVQQQVRDVLSSVTLEELAR
jgi:Rrf2 family protein